MKTLKKSIKVILGLAITIVIFGIAGRIDRTEQVIYTMPDSIYDEIKERLSAHGNHPTEYQIADYYLEHYGRR